MEARTSPSELRPPDASRRVLAVFPHPDDESYGCAGALARAHAAGDGSVLLCLTRGEASSEARREGWSPERCARVRTERLERVADRLGLAGLVVGDLPDGRLARRPLAEVAAPIAEAIRLVRPHVVIAHDPRGVNAHADHIATHWAVRRALEDAGASARLAMICYPPEVAEAARPRLLLATAPEEIDVVLELTRDELAVKSACLAEHGASVRFGPDGPPDALERPPRETFDLLGEAYAEPLDDLWTGLATDG